MFVRVKLLAQCLAQGVCAYGRVGPRSITLDATPDRLREMAIIMPARDDVPMQMRRQVAQAGEIHLVGSEQGTDDSLDCENDVHQRLALGRFEIGHLAHMGGPDNPAKARVAGVVDKHDTTGRGRPEDRPTRRGAQFADLAGHPCTQNVAILQGLHLQKNTASHSFAAHYAVAVDPDK